jgi:hypothetical protein
MLKVYELLANLKGSLLSSYAAHVYTIEYQKRGLPHLYLLLWLDSIAQFLTLEQID